MKNSINIYREKLNEGIFKVNEGKRFKIRSNNFLSLNF